MAKFLFTFYFANAAKVLNEAEDEPFVSVFSPNYEAAVRKVLKMKLPHVESEKDLRYSSAQEEVEDFGEEKQEA